MKPRMWVGLITLYIVWGGTYLAIRFAIETMPPLLMAGSRFLLAGLMFYAYSRFIGAAPPTKREWVISAVIGILLISVGNGSLTWAEQRVASGIASLVYATIPLWILVIDMLISRTIKISAYEIFGVVGGVIGIIILIGPALADIQNDTIDLFGLIVLLLAAIGIASGSIVNREAKLPASLRMGTGMQLISGAMVMLIFGLLAGELGSLDFAEISTKSLISYLYLLIFGSTVGYGVFIWLLREAPTPLVSTYAFVNPMVALLLGTIFAHEPFSSRIMLSSAIIIGSVILINIGQSISSRSQVRVAYSPRAED